MTSLPLHPAIVHLPLGLAFIIPALAVGFLHPDPATARAFTVFGLACVAVAGIWGAATVQKRILYVQTMPAVLGLAALFAS